MILNKNKMVVCVNSLLLIRCLSSPDEPAGGLGFTFNFYLQGMNEALGSNLHGLCNIKLSNILKSISYICRLFITFTFFLCIERIRSFLHAMLFEPPFYFIQLLIFARLISGYQSFSLAD